MPEMSETAAKKMVRIVLNNPYTRAILLHYCHSLTADDCNNAARAIGVQSGRPRNPMPDPTNAVAALEHAREKNRARVEAYRKRKKASIPVM